MVIEELFTRLGFQVDPKGIDKAKDALGSFKKWVGGLALGAGLISLAKTGVEAAMTMEGLNAQFTVMTGSAEKARDVIAQIADFAAHTPFDKLGLSSAAKTLMAFGLESEKVVPTLKMLGDVAGADQNKLNGLALVFGQIQSTGKLMGQDLLQLINQGFNPLTEISKQTGISVAKLKDLMSEGAISADMVTLAFKSATSAGGLFYGNLESQSQTLQGRISTLKDNFVTALQNMAEAFLPLLKNGVDMLVAYDWTPIVETVKSFGNALTSIPFETVLTWVRRLSIAVIAFATRDLQRTLVTSFARAAESGMTAFSNLTLSFTSFKGIAVGGIKSIGIAMKTALGPIGIALVAIEGFVAAYNWLEGKSREKATEEQRESARRYIAQNVAKGQKTREQVVSEVVVQQEGMKARAKKLQERAAMGGEEGKEASKELESLQMNIRKRESFVNALKDVYKEKTGMEFEVKAGVVKSPLSGSSDLAKQIAEMTKALNESSKSTKKNTKAVEDNTHKFNISDISRQAFDAAFNTKLKEAFITTI